ncbi:MAG: DNA translocase FtsK, partial [Clostridia bacterium]|nr:DNA translocase FtsK [Clostridia bacterium]
MGLTGGGVVGGLLGTLIMSAVGITGTIILAVLLILFCGIFIFGFTPRTFVKTVRYKYFSIKEKIAIRKQEKAEAAAAAREEKMQAEAIARKREERRRAEIAEQEREEREREEAENREIDRMRQNAQAHNARASEIRRENARARTVAKTAGGAEASKVKKKPVYEDDFDTEETPRAGKHGDIDDIFSADFIDGGKKKAPARAAQKPAEEEEDKEFRGSSVADFWRKNEADTETTFEELPEEDMPEGALTEEYAEEYGEEVIEPMETGESFEDEAGEEVFSCPTYESAFAGVTSEEDEIELPEEAEDEELPDDVIPWEDLTGEKTQKKTGDPVADELRRTLDVTRKKIQENAAREGAGAKTAPATTMQMQEMPEAVIPEEPVYVFPPLDLLKKDPGKSGGNEEEELHANAEKLVATLKSFNVRAKIVDVSRGPTITRYEIGLEAGTRVRTIMNLVDDISYALATNGVRIEGVIPGKSAIGIEVPNTGVRDTVYLRSLLEDKKFTDAKSKLTTALGKSVSGDNVYLDIAKMPHLLIAGTTGSGKSVCINTMLISLLYKATPDEVKLVLVDPKKVELNVYNGIPHLLVPVVFDPKKAAGALHWCVTEMERRFDLIESMNVRNIEGYNKAIEDDPTKEKLPQIVIVIDELADLMMTASNEVETSICRIAQKARAAGMHLIIGTQRPSVDVITGLIKANVPSRIAFTVMSQVDSRTIIDSVGAEKLIGRGDMLYAPVGASKPMRAQGAFVSDAELEGIIDFIKENAKKAEYSDEIMNRIEKEAALCGKKGKAREEAEEQDEGGDEEDPKLESAIKLAVESGKISTSLIQRKLSLGYGRAAKIIDVMERRGIVGAPEGQKP